MPEPKVQRGKSQAEIRLDENKEKAKSLTAWRVAQANNRGALTRDGVKLVGNFGQQLLTMYVDSRARAAEKPQQQPLPVTPNNGGGVTAQQGAQRPTSDVSGPVTGVDPALVAEYRSKRLQIDDILNRMPPTTRGAYAKARTRGGSYWNYLEEADTGRAKLRADALGLVKDEHTMKATEESEKRLKRGEKRTDRAYERQVLRDEVEDAQKNRTAVHDEVKLQRDLLKDMLKSITDEREYQQKVKEFDIVEARLQSTADLADAQYNLKEAQFEFSQVEAGDKKALDIAKHRLEVTRQALAYQKYLEAKARIPEDDFVKTMTAITKDLEDPYGAFQYITKKTMLYRKNHKGNPPPPKMINNWAANGPKDIFRTKGLEELQTAREFDPNAKGSTAYIEATVALFDNPMKARLAINEEFPNGGTKAEIDAWLAANKDKTGPGAPHFRPPSPGKESALEQKIRLNTELYGDTKSKEEIHALSAGYLKFGWDPVGKTAFMANIATGTMTEFWQDWADTPGLIKTAAYQMNEKLGPLLKIIPEIRKKLHDSIGAGPTLSAFIAGIAGQFPDGEFDLTPFMGETQGETFKFQLGSGTDVNAVRARTAFKLFLEDMIRAFRVGKMPIQEQERLLRVFSSMGILNSVPEADARMDAIEQYLNVKFQDNLISMAPMPDRPVGVPEKIWLLWTKRDRIEFVQAGQK